MEGEPGEARPGDGADARRSRRRVADAVPRRALDDERAEANALATAATPNGTRVTCLASAAGAARRRLSSQRRGRQRRELGACAGPSGGFGAWSSVSRPVHLHSRELADGGEHDGVLAPKHRPRHSAAEGAMPPLGVCVATTSRARRSGQACRLGRGPGPLASKPWPPLPPPRPSPLDPPPRAPPCRSLRSLHKVSPGGRGALLGADLSGPSGHRPLGPPGRGDRRRPRGTGRRLRRPAACRPGGPAR